MLNVQMMRGNVEIDRRNGSNHSRYHGYTTGAQMSEAAIGQAKESDGHSVDFLLSHIAVMKPASTASAAATCGTVTLSSVANTGALKRKLCT